MSITAARSYFRARSEAVGLREWKDGFNFQNIPSTILNKSFHIEQAQIVGVKLNQNDQEINSSITIRIFVKGFRDAASGIDSALVLTEDLITECVEPGNRLTQSTGIKNIVFENANIEALGPDNDNAAVASLTFRAFTVLGLL